MTAALILLAVLWIVCGVVQYGWSVAFYQQRWPLVRSKGDVLFAAVFALFGPLGLFGLILGTLPWGRAWQCGFQWRAMPSASVPR